MINISYLYCSGSLLWETLSSFFLQCDIKNWYKIKMFDRVEQLSLIFKKLL